MACSRNARWPYQSGLDAVQRYDAAMADLSFSMPPGLKAWVDAQVALGRYVDAGDYLRDLVRRDQAAAGDDEELSWLRARIAEGLTSPVIDRAAEDVLDDILAEDTDLRG